MTLTDQELLSFLDALESEHANEPRPSIGEPTIGDGVYTATARIRDWLDERETQASVSTCPDFFRCSACWRRSLLPR